jgi:hypothetical protein
MAMGGAVAGGYEFGNRAQGYYPDLQNVATIDTGQGRLIPGVAVDEYARDLLTWFGITQGDLDYVLPAFSSRFGDREPMGIIGTPYSAPASSSSSGSSSAGGGGGSMGGLATGAAGAALLLKLIADRKARLKTEENRAG